MGQMMLFCWNWIFPHREGSVVTRWEPPWSLDTETTSTLEHLHLQRPGRSDLLMSVAHLPDAGGSINVSTNRTVGGLAIHTRVVPASSVRVFNIISAVMYSWEVVIITHCTTKQWRLELGEMSHMPTGSGGLCLLALLLGPQSPQRVQTEPEMPSLLPFPSPLVQPPLSSATFYAKLLLRNRLHE